MPVLLLIAVVFVLLICLLVVADRAFKAVQRGRRLREVGRRLDVAVGQGQAKNRQRKATEQVSGALTSVIPTIHDIDTRHVDEPGEAATMWPAGDTSRKPAALATPPPEPDRWNIDPAGTGSMEH
jgi:hypothetical protein